MKKKQILLDNMFRTWYKPYKPEEKNPRNGEFALKNSKL